MWAVSLLVLMFSVGMESRVCSPGQQRCRSGGCYDPTIQACADNNATIQCLNSCNGICFPDFQYCYNNTKICYKNESVCNVKTSGSFSSSGLGLQCYDPSQLSCYNGTLCYNRYVCGAQCLTKRNTACAKNQTICFGFDYYEYSRGDRYLDLCGPQQKCYDATRNVCLNETIVCEGLNAQLCGTTCFNPDTYACIDGNVQCINLCNGSCYSSSQYCYNDAIICKNDQSACDVKYSDGFSYSSLGPICYDPSQYTCFSNTLCPTSFACGTQCSSNYYSTCVNNQTFCEYNPSEYYSATEQLDSCGPQQQCYDVRESVCVNGTTVCSKSDTELCDTTCFNPNTQICINGTVQCMNSCNAICYSASQYCYNDTKICNNNEFVCDVKTDSYFLQSSAWPPPPPSFGLTCYDPSQLNCHQNSLCYNRQVCGTQCLVNGVSICVNNETICYGFPYYFSGSPFISVCGSQQQCYVNTISVCLNGTTVCEGLNAQLCGANCFNPDTQVCVDDVVQCINSCNGTCYSNSQYCYNNTIICNINESVCDVEYSGLLSGSSLGLNCYDTTKGSCLNRRLCDNRYVCGSQCLTDYDSACARNQTVCRGFDYYEYSHGSKQLDLCGSQHQCYDSSIKVCLGNNDTLCSLGNQLCSGVCYNPQLQYCTSENSTAHCLNNPSAPDCPPSK